MNTPHPYLDPHEHPGAALLRLLQLLPDDMQETTAYDVNEAQLAEAIAFQASRAHGIITAGIEALQPLLPPTLENALPQHASISDIVLHLQNEVATVKLIAEIYQGMTADFYENNPDFARHPATPVFERGEYKRKVEENARALMARFDRHYYFPLGRLMQLLPGDITNVPRLTHEQGEMCRAVSHYAEQAFFTLKSGMNAVEKMKAIIAKYAASEPLPDTAPFLAYLQAEADFMDCNRQDYRDAARCIKREIP